jgi:hypothetical protein
MSLFVIPVSPNGGCCDCDRALDACTCCPYEIGQDSYSEYHDYDECPNIGPPCADDEASCANIIIGPVKLVSPPFKTKCLDQFTIKAYVSFFADNYGSMYGPNQSLDFDDGPCAVGGLDGEITPFVEEVGSGTGNSRAFVYATAQNSIAGGPYGLDAYAIFYLE